MKYPYFPWILVVFHHVVAFSYWCCAYEKSTTPIRVLNGPVYIECKLLKYFVTSVAEVAAGLFHCYHTAAQIKNMLVTLGHQQSVTPSKTDNLTLAGFVNDTLKKNCGKA